MSMESKMMTYHAAQGESLRVMSTVWDIGCKGLLEGHNNPYHGLGVSFIMGWTP